MGSASSRWRRCSTGSRDPIRSGGHGPRCCGASTRSFMLFWMVVGAHTDLLAVLPLLLALLAGRTLRKPLPGGRAALAAAATGVLAGIVVAVKVTFAGPVAGLAAGLQARRWAAVRRSRAGPDASGMRA